MTETGEPGITLYSDGLLSKWGFDDGDAPDGWLDWCADQGIDWRTHRSWRDGTLPELVRRFLLPKIEQQIEVVNISTAHNPIRAETVDGQDVSDLWYEPDAELPALTPESVTVPMAEVLKIAQEPA